MKGFLRKLYNLIFSAHDNKVVDAYTEELVKEGVL